MMKYLLLALLLIPVVSAEIVISQVLYDPSVESGGEAVELKNTGVAVDISGWIIRTEASDADATIPDNIVLQQGETFLIADVGWDENKDDSSWRSADYEEKLTLGNSNSGVALMNGNEIVDSVGWGDIDEIESGLVEGDPAVEVAPGMALLRVQDSDDNSQDFVEALADFQDGVAVPVTANVVISVPVIEISPSLDLDPEGVLVIMNNGDVAVNIELVFNDLVFGEHVIPKSAVNADSSFTVQAGEEHKEMVSLRIPADAVPGVYTSTLRVVIS